MRPNLGLVCITQSKEVRFRRMTRKRFLLLTREAQQEALHELYTANLERLHKAITFCARTQIRLYRVTSHLFPFSDEPVGREVLFSLEDEVREAGRRAAAENIRLVLHPDQFVVISSDKPEVIENSIKILENHALIFDLLEQPRSAWATILIHGGKGDRAERLVRVARGLPEAVRSRLAFENDERAYSAAEILSVCREAGVPMVFDAHHHVVKEGLGSFEHPSIAEMLAAARETWPDPDWQVVHISNGKTALDDPRHSDLIHVMPPAFHDAPWIEVEAKHKELAIEQIREEWLPA